MRIILCFIIVFFNSFIFEISYAGENNQNKTYDYKLIESLTNEIKIVNQKILQIIDQNTKVNNQLIKNEISNINNELTNLKKEIQASTNNLDTYRKMEKNIETVIEKYAKTNFSYQDKIVKFSQWLIIALSAILTILITTIGLLTYKRSSDVLKNLNDEAKKYKEKQNLLISEYEKKMQLLKSEQEEFQKTAFVTLNDAIENATSERITSTLYELANHLVNIDIINEKSIANIKKSNLIFSLELFNFISEKKFNEIHVLRHIFTIHYILKKKKTAFTYFRRAINIAKQSGRNDLVSILKNDLNKLKKILG